MQNVMFFKTGGSEKNQVSCRSKRFSECVAEHLEHVVCVLDVRWRPPKAECGGTGASSNLLSNSSIVDFDFVFDLT